MWWNFTYWQITEWDFECLSQVCHEQETWDDFRELFLKMFSSVPEPVRHEATSSSFLSIRRVWSGCRWVSCDGTTPFESQLSFKTMSANNAVIPHLLLCFLSLCSKLGIAFRTGKAHPVKPGKKPREKKHQLRRNTYSLAVLKWTDFLCGVRQNTFLCFKTLFILLMCLLVCTLKKISDGGGILSNKLFFCGEVFWLLLVTVSFINGLMRQPVLFVCFAFS